MQRYVFRTAALAALALLHLSCGGQDPASPSQAPASLGTSDPVSAKPGSVGAQNAPPNLIVFTSPTADNSTNPPTISGPPPLTVTFGLCRSDDPDPGDSLNWQYNFGDSGRKPFNADGSFNPDHDHECRTEHTYAEGTYTAWVSVTDKHLEDQGKGVTALARKSQAFTIKAEKARDPQGEGFGTFSGSLGPGDSVYNRPFVDGGFFATCPAPSAGWTTYFDQYHIRHVGGNVTFDTSASPGNPDTVLIVYRSPFSPGSPCGNYVGGSDDIDYGVVVTTRFSMNLPAGEYDVIVMSWGPLDVFDYVLKMY